MKSDRYATKIKKKSGYTSMNREIYEGSPYNNEYFDPFFFAETNLDRLSNGFILKEDINILKNEICKLRDQFKCIILESELKSQTYQKIAEKKFDRGQSNLIGHLYELQQELKEAEQNEIRCLLLYSPATQTWLQSEVEEMNIEIIKRAYNLAELSERLQRKNAEINSIQYKDAMQLYKEQNKVISVLTKKLSLMKLEEERLLTNSLDNDDELMRVQKLKEQLKNYNRELSRTRYTRRQKEKEREVMIKNRKERINNVKQMIAKQKKYKTNKKRSKPKMFSYVSEPSHTLKDDGGVSSELKLDTVSDEAIKELQDSNIEHTQKISELMEVCKSPSPKFNGFVPKTDLQVSQDEIEEEEIDEKPISPALLEKIRRNSNVLDGTKHKDETNNSDNSPTSTFILTPPVSTKSPSPRVMFDTPIDKNAMNFSPKSPRRDKDDNDDDEYYYYTEYEESKSSKSSKNSRSTTKSRISNDSEVKGNCEYHYYSRGPGK